MRRSARRFVEIRSATSLQTYVLLGALAAGCSDSGSGTSSDAGTGGSANDDAASNVGTGGAGGSGAVRGTGGAGAGGSDSTSGGSGNAATGGSGGTPSNTGGAGGDGGLASGGTGGTEPDGGAAMPNDAGTLPGWTLVWNDEFDGAEGTGPDPGKWVRETGGHGWGNNELQFYTDRTDNAAMNGDGSLVITAREESYEGRDHTSARLKTQGLFEHTYGRFEARIRVPEGQGIWPAFWMLGNDIGDVSWPACGEIDILENIGREPTTVHGTLHGPGYSGGNGIGDSYQLPDEARFTDAFHVYAIEWETDVVRWYVDGNLYQTRTPDDLPGGAEWVYDHPFFLLLNVAVGGLWPGYPDETTEFPQRMVVDYVRVYDRAP
jgi:beta-glucanase (GH16 family)